MNVFVGLSGGVDSAVAAHLLQQAGHRVQGIFVRIWQPEFMHCTMEEDRLSAKRVAAHLGIPFHEIDLSTHYRDTVIQDLIDGYQRGETPNPDMLCNQHIKFGALLTHVRQLGADFLATGHYARVDHGPQEVRLLRGVDHTKDQSYFLARLSQDMLSHALCPLGELEKKAVRAIAASINLPNARRPDSQGLCFVGPVTMEEFLGHYIPLAPGNVLDATGTIVGEHHGAALYTIGQRHGFSVHAKSAQEAAQYVVATDTAGNTITISPRMSDVSQHILPMHSLSWTSTTPEKNASIEFQVRYRQAPQHGTIDPTTGILTAREPQHVAPGQSIVMFNGDQCIGGGIMSVHKESLQG
ncbi:MAG: tRNA 2-thiouridine(34) synthase MnmA [Candidatus Pacebacteria bacterium]|nr:tRNA 2-thiouridine(34) synthase MnmA [Candidatus Paceibacterota bacterium]